MKLLLVSATKYEIAPLLKFFKKTNAKEFIGKYKFEKHTIDVLITGVGMTATAFYLGKTLTTSTISQSMLELQEVSEKISCLAK